MNKVVAQVPKKHNDYQLLTPLKYSQIIHFLESILDMKEDEVYNNTAAKIIAPEYINLVISGQRSLLETEDRLSKAANIGALVVFYSGLLDQGYLSIDNLLARLTPKKYHVVVAATTVFCIHEISGSNVCDWNAIKKQLDPLLEPFEEYFPLEAADILLKYILEQLHKSYFTISELFNSNVWNSDALKDITDHAIYEICFGLARQQRLTLGIDKMLDNNMVEDIKKIEEITSKVSDVQDGTLSLNAYFEWVDNLNTRTFAMGAAMQGVTTKLLVELVTQGELSLADLDSMLNTYCGKYISRFAIRGALALAYKLQLGNKQLQETELMLKFTTTEGRYKKIIHQFAVDALLDDHETEFYLDDSITNRAISNFTVRGLHISTLSDLVQIDRILKRTRWNIPRLVQTNNAWQMNTDQYHTVTFELGTAVQDGFGDLMGMLKVAQLYKRDYPGKDVELAINDRYWFDLILKRYPELDRNFSTYELQVGGVRAKYYTSQQQFLKRQLDSDVSVFLMTADNCLEDKGLSKVNIYLEERGCNDRVKLPPWMIRNQTVYCEQHRNLHFAMATGFHLGSHGMTIDSILSDRFSESTFTKEGLIAELILEKPELIFLFEKLNGSIINSEWSFSYNHKTNSRQIYERNQFYGLMFESLGIDGNRWGVKPQYNKKITVFDFGDPRDYLDVLKHREFNKLHGNFYVATHVFPDGQILEGSDPSVTIIHPGAVSNALFLRFMQAADLPIQVTGSSTIEDAIVLGKPFFYDRPNWHVGLQHGLLEVALRHFKPEEAAFLGAMIFGYSGIKNEHVQNLALKYKQSLKNRVVYDNSYGTKIEYGHRLFTDSAAQDLFQRFLKIVLEKTLKISDCIDSVARKSFAENMTIQ